jgi:hypothetical protein
MSFIKLTSFQSWKSELSRSGDGCPPDLLINPDHVLRVSTDARGTIVGGLLYMPSVLIFADKVVRVAESHGYIREASFWAQSGQAEPHRHRDAYVKGVRTDDYGNPIEEEATAQQ